MRYEVVMPQLGHSMTEGSVIKWLKQPGERVEKGDYLFEVETDKVNMEVESLVSGFFETILIEPGKTVPVGAVIATISDQVPSPVGIGIPKMASEPERQPDAKAAAREPIVLPSRVAAATDAIAEHTLAGVHKRVSPRARKLAHELGVDLSLVESAKSGGRITEACVRRYFEQASATATPPHPSEADYEVETLSVARRAIATKMAASFREVPHFYLNLLADASKLNMLREDLIDRVNRLHGVRLTYTDLLIKSLALALAENPHLNVSWQDDELVRCKRIHIGLAVQTPGILVVPVIRDADRLPVPELARIRHDLVERARTGRLNLPDLEDATCTLTNLGSFGVDQFSAIINMPQTAILAVGRIALRPVVVNGQVVARLSVPLTLSVDHRAVDGVEAATLLRSIVGAIESPYKLLLTDT